METIIGYFRDLGVLVPMYAQMAQDATPVQCVRMKDVFTGEQMRFLGETYHAEQKQCYRNAFNLVSLIAHPFSKIIGFNPDSVRYVDGFVYEPGLIPIEHAFVRIGDQYVDPTFERVLKRDVTQCKYVSLVELNLAELCDMLEHRGYHGPIYPDWYNMRLHAK